MVVQRPTPWLRGPLWDTALIAFPWVPICAWLLFGLGFASGTAPIASRPEFRVALTAILALTFLHRQYVFLLVYGDRRTFALRPRAFVVVPCVLAAIGLMVLVGRARWPFLLPILLASVGAWNVWHTLMQRYGLLRVYAARAGGKATSPARARLDRAVLWATVALVVTSLVARPALLLDHPTTVRIITLTAPLWDGPAARIALAVALVTWLALASTWLRAELRSTGPRAPRLVFMGSTIALFAVFVVGGPVLGYLTFGAAHALEYVAFVHHTATKKYQAGGAPIASVFRTPALAFGLMLLVPAIYATLDGRGITALAGYVVYEATTAIAHFVFDGWVWKVRSPSVATAAVAE